MLDQIIICPIVQIQYKLFIMLNFLENFHDFNLYHNKEFLATYIDFIRVIIYINFIYLRIY